jgi:hypothetical protein
MACRKAARHNDVNDVHPVEQAFRECAGDDTVVQDDGGPGDEADCVERAARALQLGERFDQ